MRISTAYKIFRRIIVPVGIAALFLQNAHWHDFPKVFAGMLLLQAFNEWRDYRRSKRLV